MPESGPFETEGEALATKAAAIIRAAMRAGPGRGAGVPECMQLLTAACADAGVELGEYDRSILNWLAWGEASACVAIAGMIRRANQPPEGTRWAVSIDPMPGLTSVTDEEAARRIVNLLRAQGVSSVAYSCSPVAEPPETAKEE